MEEEKLIQSIGETIHSDNIFGTVRDLCFLGSRFSGTKSEKEVRKYIVEYLADIGIKAKEWDFEYQGWQRGTCDFELIEPERKSFPAISLVLAPSTSDDGFEEEILLGGGGSEMELNEVKSAITSKILMVHSGKTRMGWLHRRIKYANAIKHGAKCFIFSNHNPGQLFPTGSVASNKIGSIPAIGISKETYEYIKNLINMGKKVTSRIKVTNNTPKDMSKHIIWEIPGENSEKVIVIGGHYDGHDLAQGATDNAGSIAVLLEVTRLFQKHKIKPHHTLRFIAFGVEEFGVVGSTIYTNKEKLDEVIAMINLDGVIGHIPKHIACNGNEEFFKIMLELSEKMIFDSTVSKSIITASDNYPFLCKGIPNLCIYGENPDPRTGRGYGHTSADTFDKISKLDAKISLAFILNLIFLMNSIENFPKRYSQTEVVKMLKEAKLEKNLRLLEKWPF